MTNPRATQEGQVFPACVDAETAARYLGWPPYFMALLARAGHLKPLGRPAQNARKWYAMVELERVSRDAAWLDKAVRIVEKSVQDAGEKRRGYGPRVALAPSVGSN
ncbi:MAG TPA: hypothetical protein VLT36_03490 [Candidatus Dormibacteraeota bacterium]|nr:hypothetical protein [Candidatus Dormibacteraeota bacterium]